MVSGCVNEVVREVEEVYNPERGQEMASILSRFGPFGQRVCPYVVLRGVAYLLGLIRCADLPVKVIVRGFRDLIR